MASSSSSSSSISLMASQTLILQNPTFFRPSILPFSNSIHKSTFSSSKPLRFRFSSTNPKKALILNSISPSIPPPALSPNSPEISPLTGATRTVTTLLAIAVTVSKLFAQKFTKFAVNSNLSAVAGPLFFATMSGGRPGRLHTPLTVVAAGMAKWLDIYSGVLLVRVLLSWFPNIPWDRQPLSAIRDLCDPYLNLFRNIIPPVFDTLDVSPLLAFAVLGLLSGIMTSSKMI